ncbi:MAG: glycoside hydrolase family 130 protein [Deltaproteobacteria bacterium]|nr:glycoside hydrolase family 130 protein [Deltaproteobacteria bacterium]MBW2595402.1 glycoside hydrolase family 130 protein [Deltaproteobacteria bacterium]
MTLTVRRLPNKFYPDPARVISRFYMPGSEDRVRSIIKRILDFSDQEVGSTLNEVLSDFSKRHRNISKVFEKNFDTVKYVLTSNLRISPDTLSLERKLLIGSYFTSEYAIEAAAFFNPSIVEDPNQGNLEEGQERVIVSFRAVGEGHISSIVFRGGIITRDNELIFKLAGRFVDLPETVKRHVYDKKHFLEKLQEMHVQKDIIGFVMSSLGDKFTYRELQESIAEISKKIKLSYSKEKVINAMNWLASSHYEISFSLDTAISERVIFPVSTHESNGIEDARFVRFTNGDGSVTYFATYTAYNGYTILPKSIETKDFYHFKISPIYGKYTQNKNLSLFPKKISGKYAMLSRHDGVNNYIMFSDDIHFWRHAQKIQEPRYPWEFIQLGNCGSPIETEKGWLVITHGVGPMRRYSLGAVLLDLEDPSKIIGQLRKPLLMANEKEREGYVPNVVYSCGSLIHNGDLIIPYGMSDYASGFATVPVNELLNSLLND